MGWNARGGGRASGGQEWPVRWDRLANSEQWVVGAVRGAYGLARLVREERAWREEGMASQMGLGRDWRGWDRQFGQGWAGVSEWIGVSERGLGLIGHFWWGMDRSRIG